MDAPIEVGLKRSVKAYEKERERQLYDIWLADRHSFKDEYKYDFSAYLEALIPRKIDKAKVDRDKEVIDIETQRIKQKFARKGVIE